jgi:hypothetical protein
MCPTSPAAARVDGVAILLLTHRGEPQETVGDVELGYGKTLL